MLRKGHGGLYKRGVNFQNSKKLFVFLWRETPSTLGSGFFRRVSCRHKKAGFATWAMISLWVLRGPHSPWKMGLKFL